MTILTKSAELAAFCKGLETCKFITVDTEFLRDKTYYAKLCLIQLSGPDKQAVAVDVIANPEIDLTPVLKLFKNEKILKVFHAGRQDLEIFQQQFKTIPAPLFDTQIAAMVCGYGDQIGFDNLARQILSLQIDKSQQFTDWSRRPLSKKQIQYALDDVIHLVDMYEHLDAQLIKRDREDWVLEETANLTDPALYDANPEKAWEKIKVKSSKPKQLAVLREIAAWREKKAQDQDIPKSRILRDETMVDISFHPPQKPSDLSRIRGFPKGCEEKPLGTAILIATKAGLESPKESWPKPAVKTVFPKQYQGGYEMLKMFLKIRASDHDVAARLIASSDDLEAIAQYGAQADTPALKGWRRRLFGEDALKLLNGEYCLTLKKGQVVMQAIS